MQPSAAGRGRGGMCRSSTKGRAKGRGCGRQLLGGRSSGWLLPGGCDWLLLLRSSDWSGWLLRSSGWLLCSKAATRARMLRRGRHESASRGRKVANQELRQKNGWKACRAFYFEAEERRIDEQYRTCTVCTKMSRKARVAAPRARATRPLVWRTIQLSPGRGRGLRARWPMAQLWPRTCRVSFYSLILFP